MPPLSSTAIIAAAAAAAAAAPSAAQSVHLPWRAVNKIEHALQALSPRTVAFARAPGFHDVRVLQSMVICKPGVGGGM
jgi:hypothetical protein